MSTASSKKVSIVSVDQQGRHHRIEGTDETYNIHKMYDDDLHSSGMSEAEIDTLLDDEESYDLGLKAFEEIWLRSNGVTHIRSREDFGDNRARPLQDYLST